MKKIVYNKIIEKENGYIISPEKFICDKSDEWLKNDEDPIIAYVENCLDNLDKITWDKKINLEFDFGSTFIDGIYHILFYDNKPREIYYIENN